jgi:hypothetical protein
MGNNLHSLYPDDPRQYDPLIRPAFDAARRAYPNAVKCEPGPSRWILEPNTFEPRRLMLAQYPDDDNPNPVHHWMFQCNLDELCVWCHDGYGGRLCLRHQLLRQLLIQWGYMEWYIREVSDFLDRHLIAKLALLTVAALLMGWLLIVRVYLSGYINALATACAIVCLTALYVAHVVVVIHVGKQTRMSEQADNNVDRGDD